MDQEGRAPVQYFSVDGEWQASDANVADQPFLLQLQQLRNGLLYYLKYIICQLTQRLVCGLSAVTAILLQAISAIKAIMMLYKAVIQGVMRVLWHSCNSCKPALITFVHFCFHGAL